MTDWMNSLQRALARTPRLAALTLVIAASPDTMATTSEARRPAEPVVATATVRAADRVLRLTETAAPGGGVERSYLEGGRELYRSSVTVAPDGFEVRVTAGHPSQLGRVVIAGGRLAAFDAASSSLWTQTLTERVCFPELFAEFVRAHWDRLEPGAEPLRCVTPILKARKVAPLQWRRLPDEPDGRRVVEVAAGSLGMRLFMSPTRLVFSADGARVLAQSGQFEAPVRTDGRAAYLRGEARYTQPREAMPWPAARFAVARDARSGSAP